MRLRFGAKIKLADGREGTVVYHGLDGYGIKFGHHNVAEEDIGGDGNTNHFLGGRGRTMPEDYQWAAEAMLRDNYPSAQIECVGKDFEIVS